MGISKGETKETVNTLLIVHPQLLRNDFKTALLINVYISCSSALNDVCTSLKSDMYHAAKLWYYDFNILLIE